jgi:DNA-binding MarR family transcriptional regulator
MKKVAEVKMDDVRIGALLRVPSQAIHRRILKELNAAGFDELRMAHIPVLQYPGPDGVSPSILAERAGMSKQAMNQLLKSLEGCGYIIRSDAPSEGRSRVVHLTKRGHAAFSAIYNILGQVESEWSDELGSVQFAQLKKLLNRVWKSGLTQ